MSDMQYRRLGRAGVKVSALSFGSWVTYGNQLGTDTARECMAAAYDAGVNFFVSGQNAEQTLRTMLSGLGYKDIRIQEEP